MIAEKLLKNPPSTPFDKLRANGGAPEIGEHFPFVLSLSKHGFVILHNL